MQEIIIAGGGTAGLITALILKSRLNVNIKMIVPSDIGIIGVGEGSTEHWISFLDFIKETRTNALVETYGTIKTGIYFSGWTSQDYIHSIGAFFDPKMGNTYAVYADMMANGNSNKEMVSPEMWENKIGDFGLEVSGHNQFNQFHFNTFKLNEYLTKIAKRFNIEIIDDKIVDVQIGDEGVEHITTEQHGKLTADWYIDSTGFKKVLIGAVGGQWKSYSWMLPLKEAIAFPTEDQTPNYNMWTRAKALNAGWMWTIPTYGRTGNGYIFDTDFITKEQAHEEVNKLFGREIEIAKHIKFNPGQLDEVWIKNVIAVGLSANFLEPLEATSIGTSIQQAFLLMHKLYPNVLQRDIDQYNKHIDQLMQNTRDFVALHYINDNRKSDFWKRCAELIIPETLQKYIDIWKHRPLDTIDIDDDCNSYNLFGAPNYNLIAYYHGLLKSETVKKYLNTIQAEEFIEYYKERNINRITGEGISYINHKDYIEKLHD